MEEELDEKIVFATRWFDILEAAVPGRQGPYYVLRSPESVAILALTQANRIPLIRQYRPALKEYSLELPSGHVEPGDTSPETAARRELLEETGYLADNLELLGALHANTARLRSRVSCFFAPHVRYTGKAEGGDEEIEVCECTPAEVLEHAQSGRLRHAQDLAAVLLAALHGHLRRTFNI